MAGAIDAPPVGGDAGRAGQVRQNPRVGPARRARACSGRLGQDDDRAGRNGQQVAAKLARPGRVGAVGLQGPGEAFARRGYDHLDSDMGAVGHHHDAVEVGAVEFGHDLD